MTLLRSKFDGYPGSLAQEKRRLSKNGPMTVNRDKCHLWLFTDIVVVTKADKKGRFKFVQQFGLKTASFSEDEGAKFRMLSTEGSLACQAPTLQEKEEWKKAISSNLNEARASLMKSAFGDEVCLLIILLVVTSGFLSVLARVRRLEVIQSVRSC